jgi:hypothetical protein
MDNEKITLTANKKRTQQSTFLAVVCTSAVLYRSVEDGGELRCLIRCVGRPAAAAMVERVVERQKADTGY